jgi:alpha-L-rhamnosidase
MCEIENHSGQFFYIGIAGIQPLAPGYRKILIAPTPGGGLSWARCSYRCHFGTIFSNWTVTPRGHLTLHVEIPAGTIAFLSAGTLGEKGRRSGISKK